MSNQEKLEELVRQLHNWKQVDRDHKVGRVLTIIDAAFTDPEQRKATKDLVKEVFYEDSMIGGISQVHLLVKQYAESEGIKIFPKASIAEDIEKITNPFNNKK